MKFEFQYLLDCPILDAECNVALGGNLNGPSLVRVPDWVVEPLGKYYLYFAHHEGCNIRLACADDLTGPWSVYVSGALSLEHSLFCQQAPLPADTHPAVLASIAAGIDGDYPHIASPDVHIDSARHKIIMYYHGRNEDGTQQTRLAESDDGVNFTPLASLLGDSYFRVFQYQGTHYAIAWGSKLYRSVDGGFTFEDGPRLTQDNYRHGAILVIENTNDVYVVWSRAGDCPESLLVSRLVFGANDRQEGDTGSGWRQWHLGPAEVLHQPKRVWEGCSEPLEPSSYGGIMKAVNEIRDPCIFCEEDQVYLLYSVRGEQGIALGRLVLSA